MKFAMTHLQRAEVRQPRGQWVSLQCSHDSCRTAQCFGSQGERSVLREMGFSWDLRGLYASLKLTAEEVHCPPCPCSPPAQTAHETPSNANPLPLSRGTGQALPIRPLLGHGLACHELGRGGVPSGTCFHFQFKG